MSSAAIVDKFCGNGAYDFMVETSRKSDELTKEKIDILSSDQSEEEKNLRIISLLEKIQAFQEIIRKGHRRFNLDISV